MPERFTPSPRLRRAAMLATMLVAIHGNAGAQRISPAAFASARDSTPRLAMSDRARAQRRSERAAQDSVRSGPERIAGVIGGALIGGAIGLAVAAVYAPKIFCDICQPGNAPAESRNKYFFRGPMIGIGVGAIGGWWFYGRP